MLRLSSTFYQTNTCCSTHTHTHTHTHFHLRVFITTHGYLSSSLVSDSLLFHRLVSRIISWMLEFIIDSFFDLLSWCS